MNKGVASNKTGPASNIKIVCATRFPEQEFWEKSALGQSLKPLLEQDPRLSATIAYSNSKGLPEVYNAVIDNKFLNALLVFVHDDVWLEQENLADTIQEALDAYDIVGVAGNRRLLPSQPSWAFIDENFTWDKPEFLSGEVRHGQKPGGELSRYGVVPAECQLLDGVLLAASSTVLRKAGVKFDPRFRFHFYDLDFCRSATAKGLRLGTWKIDLTHQSGGSFGNEAWREAYQAYQEKWSHKRLPLNTNETSVTHLNLERKQNPISLQTQPGSPSALAGTLNTITQRASSAEDKLIDEALRIGQRTHAALDSTIKNLVSHAPEYKSMRGRLPKLYLKAASSILSRLKARPVTEDDARAMKAAQHDLKQITQLVAATLKKGQQVTEAERLQEEARKIQQDLRYRRWRRMHSLQEVDGQLFGERMMNQWKHHPVFHFVLFLLPGDEPLLGDTLDSLSAQFYQDWRLTVVADGPAPDPLWEQLEVLQWLQCGSEDDPHTLVNESIEKVSSDWVAFIDPGTRWEPHTLLRLGDYANLKPEWRFIYSDSDTVSANGEFSEPRFLPDLNIDMLRSTPYCRQGAWVRRDALLDNGGFEPLPGCEMHDQIFKVIEQAGAQAIGHIADSLTHVPAQCRQPDTAVVARTVKNHLDRLEISTTVTDGYLPGTLRIEYLHQQEASVSIIIPSRDKYEYIESCLRSLFERTEYTAFEVIIADRGSVDPDTLALYQQFEERHQGRVSVLRFDAETSVAEACNRAAMLARGDYLVFLKNHVEARQSQWLSRLLLHAQRPDVGAVGPRVVHAESTLLFEAGVILGMDDVAGKPFVNQLTLQGKGYLGRAQIDQNFSAIGDTCLATPKSLFIETGGFDAQSFSKDFFVADYCLRVNEAGRRILWTPFSMLMAYKGTATINKRDKGHEYLRDVIEYESARSAMLEKWMPHIGHDPAYNPNLDLNADHAFLVDDKLPINWDVEFHERTRVAGLPLRGGSGEYRVIQPFDALSKAALQQTEHYRMDETSGGSLRLPAIARMAPDTLVVQAAIDDMHVGLLQDLANYQPDIFRVFTLDDLITEIPEKSSTYKRHMGHFRNARARMRKALSLCDRMIVTTQVLAEAYADMIDDIRVIPNRLQRDVWLPLTSRRRTGNKPRVGWVGAHQHAGDLEIIIEVVKQTADKLDWVFMGMCPEAIRPLVKEMHLDWVEYDEYPKKMASLNLDIAVAPLEIHRFNEAKSNLRLLEYGILGWPVVCTDIAPYRDYDAPVRRVPNDTKAWVEAIMAYADDLDAAAQAGDRLKQWVMKHFILEDHLEEWVSALTAANARAGRKPKRGIKTGKAAA